MLNYFLKTLTGPDRKSFKVSNLEKYSFKPGEVVQKIAQIYINLRDSQTFIKAISSDGRSYSAELFSWAESVLLKVNRHRTAEIKIDFWSWSDGWDLL